LSDKKVMMQYVGKVSTYLADTNTKSYVKAMNSNLNALDVSIAKRVRQVLK